MVYAIPRIVNDVVDELNANAALRNLNPTWSRVRAIWPTVGNFEITERHVRTFNNKNFVSTVTKGRGLRVNSCALAGIRFDCDLIPRSPS